MGNRWDYDVPSVNVFVEVLRVLRPGAPAMFFGGTRTFHRMAVNIEDAGFELRDTCIWMHGQGFPKSTDIAKALDKKEGRWRGRASVVQSGNVAMGGANYGRTPKGDAIGNAAKRWEGYGTALKPAFEPAILARKQLVGTIVENVQKHGVGGLAIDVSRVGSDGLTPASIAPVNVTGYEGKTVMGRWPANVQLSHSPDCVQKGQREVKSGVAHRSKGGGKNFGSEVQKPLMKDLSYADEHGREIIGDWECVDDCPVKILDEQSGDRPGMSGGGKHREDYRGGMFGGIDSSGTARGDRGGASRFFFTAKASRSERDEGLAGTTVPESCGVGALRDGGRGKKALNTHATVKPVDLCRYFARLMLPPSRPDGKPRRIVVPYSGSGSEMLGCLLAGWDEVVGIELQEKHATVARTRIVRGFAKLAARK